jgi:hypothetical protein
LPERSYADTARVGGFQRATARRCGYFGADRLPPCSSVSTVSERNCHLFSQGTGATHRCRPGSKTTECRNSVRPQPLLRERDTHRSNESDMPCRSKVLGNQTRKHRCPTTIPANRAPIRRKDRTTRPRRPRTARRVELAERTSVYSAMAQFRFEDERMSKVSRWDLRGV